MTTEPSNRKTDDDDYELATIKTMKSSGFSGSKTYGYRPSGIMMRQLKRDIAKFRKELK